MLLWLQFVTLSYKFVIMQDIIVDNIRKIRELKNISREYMASKLHISETQYGKIERNETDITIKRIIEIADILEVPYSKIFELNMNQILNNTLGNNAIIQGANAHNNQAINSNDLMIHITKLLDIVMENQQLILSFLKEKK